MTFRPTLWATIAAAAGLAVLLGLGTWQLDRWVWKQRLLEVRTQRVEAPAITYADIAADADLDALEYRLIRLTGRFDGSHSLKLLNRTRDGRPGFHVITPMVTNAAGDAVLIDRGWAPVAGAAGLSPIPAGLVSIEGYVRRFETPGPFIPDNEPDTGAWFYFDRAQMAAATGFEAVAPFYVQRAPGAAPSGDYPAGGVPNIALRNPHLLYAITWYALAIVLLVIYVVFHVRRRGGAGAAKNEQNR